MERFEKVANQLIRFKYQNEPYIKMVKIETLYAKFCLKMKNKDDVESK